MSAIVCVDSTIYSYCRHKRYKITKCRNLEFKNCVFTCANDIDYFFFVISKMGLYNTIPQHTMVARLRIPHSSHFLSAPFELRPYDCSFLSSLRFLNIIVNFHWFVCVNGSKLYALV